MLPILNDLPQGEPAPAISIRQPWAGAVAWLGTKAWVGFAPTFRWE